MKALVQRVSEASVRVQSTLIASINRGLLVFVGFTHTDTTAEIVWMTKKLLGLRIFPNTEGKIDWNVQQIEGSLLVVPQFTLYGCCSHGLRPDFLLSAPRAVAKDLYHQCIASLQQTYPLVKQSVFQEEMQIHLLNEGPFTLLLDSKEKA